MCPMCIAAPETTTGLDAKAVTEGGDERWLRYLRKLMRLTCSQRCILVCKNVWVRFGIRDEGQPGNSGQFHHVPSTQLHVSYSRFCDRTWGQHVEGVRLHYVPHFTQSSFSPITVDRFCRNEWFSGAQQASMQTGNTLMQDCRSFKIWIFFFYNVHTYWHTYNLKGHTNHGMIPATFPLHYTLDDCC